MLIKVQTPSFFTKNEHSLNRRIVQLEFTASPDSFLHVRVPPKSSDSVRNIAWQGIRLNLSGKGENNVSPCIILRI